MNEGVGGNEGINRLARTLQGRMHQVGDRPPILDFGKIQGDMSLLTNYFPKSIPQTDYIVCRSVSWGAASYVGAKFRWLQPGDRVLVAWVGDDACVVDLILPATAI